MALTDISGIGSKTAQKLREEGITTKQELLQAFRNNDSRVVGGPFDDGLSSRALDGIREELANAGEQFIDPVYGVPVDEDKKQAFDAFNLELGSDVAEGFGEFTRDKGGIDAGMNVLEAAGEAITGDLGKLFQPSEYDELKPEKYSNFDSNKREGLEEADPAEKSTKEAFEFGLDAAANLSPFNRETIEQGNELARQTAGMGTFTVQQTEQTQRETSQGTIEAEDNIGVPADEYAESRNYHSQRSPEARRVDNNRKAETTSDVDKWKRNANEYDFPGVDTPGGTKDIVTEDQQEQAQQVANIVDQAEPKVTEIAFGNSLEDKD